MLYMRYIDDILCIGDSATNSFIETAHRWHTCIRLDATGETCSGDPVPYLDLQLSIEANKVHWCLFEKPQAQYLYLPWGSAHSTASKAGIATGCFTRIARRHMSPHDPRVHTAQARLHERLRIRGYPNAVLRSALQRSKQLPIKQMARRKCILELAQQTNRRRVQSIVRDFTKHSKLNAVVRWKLPSNNFLRRYRSTWRMHCSILH